MGISIKWDMWSDSISVNDEVNIQFCRHRGISEQTGVIEFNRADIKCIMVNHPGEVIQMVYRVHGDREHMLYGDDNICDNVQRFQFIFDIKYDNRWDDRQDSRWCEQQVASADNEQ